MTIDYATRGVPMGVKLNQIDPGGGAVDCNILQVLEGFCRFGKDDRAAILSRQASHHKSWVIIFKGSHGIVRRLKTIMKWGLGMQGTSIPRRRVAGMRQRHQPWWPGRCEYDVACSTPW